MNAALSPIKERPGLLLPLATVCLVGWLALPSLITAWGNDLYAKGLPLAFLIWIAPQLYYFSLVRSSSKPHSHFWIGLSLFFCVLGSMSDFNILYHLALAAAIPGFCGLRGAGLLAFIGAGSWFSALGWAISHFIKGGLMGWERPFVAALISLVIYYSARSVTKRSAPSL
jgi:hypothetical protein